MAAKPEIDDVTGVETTGHEWDGLKELNKPLPSWWVWTFWATIIWSIGYWIAYPAWPLVSNYTAGYLGFSSRQEALDDVKKGRAGQQVMNDALAKTSITELGKNPELMKFAVAGGKVIFGDNCSPCHGRGAAGGNGYPNLNDDDWIWGGKIDQINFTVTHGVRSGDKDERTNTMPPFADTLKPEQINDTADFVLSLSGTKGDAAAIERGKQLFADNCASCHGDTGKGNPDMGAPNLADKIWLYGGKKADIVAQIKAARGGVMPAWNARLDAEAIKKVTAYVWSLGGGAK